MLRPNPSRVARALLAGLLAWLAPACGEEDEAPSASSGQATPARPAGAAATPRAGAGSGTLEPQLTIEERVPCLVESNAQKKCDPKAPKCATKGEHCLTNSEGSFCGPCKERDTIRHAFKPRDFVATVDTRDPFQSFFVAQPGLGPREGDKVPRDETKSCTRDDQVVALSSSYLDLKLVGIVTQGTQRKSLMLDSTNLGHIIRRGDCVGREKAVVREIGTDFISFEIAAPGMPGAANREPVQRTVQLYPKQIPVASLPTEDPPRAPSAPIASPPPLPSAVPVERPPANTRIQIVSPPPQGPVVPPQAPTTLNP